MQNNVDVKQDLKSNQSLVIPGGEEVEGYGGGEIIWLSGGEQRENQSSPTVYKGGGIIENPLPVNCQ